MGNLKLSKIFARHEFIFCTDVSIGDVSLQLLGLCYKHFQIDG